MSEMSADVSADPRTNRLIFPCPETIRRVTTILYGEVNSDGRVRDSQSNWIN